MPLTAEAKAIIDRRSAGLKPTALLLARTLMESMSRLVREISRKMITAGEAREPFRLSDLRRTCETMLAALKVSSDVRAHLLSHGLSGVQAKHYDMHTYHLEMLAALRKWARHLAALKAGKTAAVVPIPTAQPTPGAS